MTDQENEPGQESKKSGHKIEIKLELKEILEILKKFVSHGKEAMHSLEKKLDEAIQSKLQKGEISNEEAKSMAEDIKQKARDVYEKITGKIESTFKKTLKGFNLATIDDLKKLEKQIDDLADLLQTRLKETPPQKIILKKPASQRKKPVAKKSD